MAEFQQPLWAPWRMEYVGAAPRSDAGCFLCEYVRTPDADDRNLVVSRDERCVVVLNRFPYNNGHVLIAPVEHIGEMDDICDSTLHALASRIRDVQRVLRSALNPQGFNIGLNLGRCAGAGLPEHLHWHIVPRWAGDTNFMPVLADVHVIPQALAEVARRYREAALSLGIR